MVQALLDPSSLEEKDLHEIRGKAFMLRMFQEMPRLVEESLAEFQAQRLGQEEEKKDA